jgi:hypothetical protein
MAPPFDYMGLPPCSPVQGGVWPPRIGWYAVSQHRATPQTCSRRSCSVHLAMGSDCSDWAACLDCPSGVVNKPKAHCAVPTVAIVGPGMRSRQAVMVPILSRMAPQVALVDSLPLKPSGELGQSDASEHILLAVPWRWCGFSPVDSTSCPPRRR